MKKKKKTAKKKPAKTKPGAIPDLVAAVLAHREAETEIYPCHANRASELGHPCDRYLFYCRTAWDKRPRPNTVLQGIFRQGSVFEKDAIQEFLDTDLEFEQSQAPFKFLGRMNELLASGRIDGMIGEPRRGRRGPKPRKYPVEIKSINPYDWEAMNDASDMLGSKKPWLRKYPAQLTLYMLMSNSEKGIFWLVNKATYQVKQINLDLDYEYAEELIQKAERINKAVGNDEIPDRMSYEHALCSRCDFRDLCIPGFEGAIGIEFVDMPKLRKLLDTRRIHTASASTYRKVDKEAKEILKKAPAKLVVGNWYVERKETEKRVSYTIEEIKKEERQDA